MNFAKRSCALFLLTIFSYVGLFECSYFSLGSRCLYGDCSEYQSSNRYYGSPSDFRAYNKQIYTKPAYFKPSYVSSSYVQPSPYRLRYPSYVRNNVYQQPRRYIRPIRPEVPAYEIVEINQNRPAPLANLAYYPVNQPGTGYERETYNGIDTPSRIVNVLNGEREGIVQPKPIYEEDPDNEVDVGVWETVDGLNNNGRMQDAKSLDPNTCRKHEDCTKFCEKSVNSVGVFGSCYNGSCRCGIRS